MKTFCILIIFLIIFKNSTSESSEGCNNDSGLCEISDFFKSNINNVFYEFENGLCEPIRAEIE